jgi:methylmalonyl-CoA/ethylmalonyl-CoA epimerase
VSQVRFDHIALALPRVAAGLPLVVGRLGGVPEAGGAAREFRWGAWVFAGGGRLELLEPLGAAGFVHRFLEQRGPGVHHVTFTVDDLARACERARALGYDVVGYDDSRSDWKEAFLHPKQALGIVVQFAQPAPNRERRWRWQPPPAPPAPPPATLVGLRLRAASAERARRQWAETLLGAEERATDGAVVYRWSDSPMRIAVDIDAAGAEGPVAIEVAGAPGFTAITALGTRFVPAA